MYLDNCGGAQPAKSVNATKVRADWAAALLVNDANLCKLFRSIWYMSPRFNNSNSSK
jgi:hypothetical protein